MSGASLAHNHIQVNFIAEARAFLKGKGCDVFGSDLLVHIPFSGLYTYPDAVIICGHPELRNKEADTLVNPAVLVEVLSKSMQSYDRGDTFNLYRTIPSLQEYILIASVTVGVAHYTKQKNNTWLLKGYNQLQAALPIKTINFSVLLAELYRGVSFT